MKKLIQLILVLIMTLSLSGCSQSTGDINHNLGGWLDNSNNKVDDENDNKEDEKDDDTNHQTSQGQNVDKIEYNTDDYLSNVHVEIEDYFDEYIIFKVTNNSSNCYRFLNIYVYFTCDPLPNHRPLEDGEEYDNPYNFMNVPAYSTTYYIKQALGEEMSSDKGGDVDGRVYYDFNPKSDSYRIEIRGKEDKWDPSTLSDKLLQNANDYIVFDRSSYDSNTNKLGDVINKANRPVEFNGFVVFADGHVAEIQNGSELIDSTYRFIIPPMNQKYYAYADKAYDCNSIYTKPFDFEGDIEYFDIYINSYFVDDVE